MSQATRYKTPIFSIKYTKYSHKLTMNVKYEVIIYYGQG